MNDSSKRAEPAQDGSARAFDPRPYLRRIRTRGQESDYLDVKWRLVWLRTEHPDASIVTEHITIDDASAVFRATVAIPNGGSATGYGSETRSDFVDYIEKAETKSIGRALAALGYGTQFALDFDLEEGPEGRPIADAPVERPPAEQRGGRQQAPERRPPAPEQRARPEPDPEPSGPHAIAEDRPDADDADGGDVNLADYTWTHFWPWAKGLGYEDKATIEELLGRSIQGMTPREVRELLVEHRGENE
jgi:hypothetical protein